MNRLLRRLVTMIFASVICIAFLGIVEPKSQFTTVAQTLTALPSDLAYIGNDGNAWLYDSNTNQSHRLTSGGKIRSLTWEPNGNRLAVARRNCSNDFACKNDEIIILDLASRKESRVATNFHLFSLSSLAWSPDGNRLGFLSDDLSKSKSGVAVSIKMVDVLSNQVTTVHTVEMPGLGIGVPFLTSGISWSPSGKYLLFAPYASTTEIISVDGWKTISKLNRFNNPRWSPDELYVVGHNFESIRIVDPNGNETKTIKPDSTRREKSFSWGPAGKSIAFAGLTGVWNIDLQTGKSIRLVNTEAWEPSWSSNGEWLAFTLIDWTSSGLDLTPLGIGVSNSNGTNYSIITKGGLQPTWRPKLQQTRVSLSSDLVASKQQSIAKLSNLRVDFLETCEIPQFSFPAKSFDESLAIGYLSELNNKSKSGTLTNQEITGLERLDLFESGLVRLHQNYMVSADDVTESVIDGVAITFSLVDTINKADALLKKTPGVGDLPSKLLAKVREKTFDLLNDSTQSIAHLIPDPNLRQAIEWDAQCMVQVLRLKAGSGSSIKNWLIESSAKTVGGELLTSAFVRATQPTLDDAVGKAKSPIDNVRGTTSDARIRVETLLKSVDTRTTAAHDVHQKIMMLVDVSKTLADISDLTTLLTSPSGIGIIIAQSSSLASKVLGEGLLLGSAINHGQNMIQMPADVSATQKLAFDPRVSLLPFTPVETNSIRSGIRALPIIQSNLSPAVAPQLILLDQRIDDYTITLDKLLSALNTGDLRQIDAVTNALLSADELLTVQFRIASDPMITFPQNSGYSVLAPKTEIYASWAKAQSQFDIQSLSLFAYLIDNMIEPNSQKARQNTKQQIEIIRKAVKDYRRSIEARVSSNANSQNKPIISIASVSTPMNLQARSPFKLVLSVNNNGTVVAQDISIKIDGDLMISPGNTIAISTLQPGESRSIEFNATPKASGIQLIAVSVFEQQSGRVGYQKWIIVDSPKQHSQSFAGFEFPTLILLAVALASCLCISGFSMFGLVWLISKRKPKSNL